MAVAFDNVTNTTVASSATWTVTKPAHVDDTDLVVVVMSQDNPATVSTAPSGWTLIGSQAGGADGQIHVYGKIASSEPASWQWTFSVAKSGACSVGTYTGAHPTSWLDVTPGLNTVTSATAESASITPTGDNRMIVAVYGCDPPAAGISGTPDTSPAATERVDFAETAMTGYVYWQDYLQATAAAVSLTGTFTASDSFGIAIFAIAPDAGGAPPAAPPDLTMAPMRG